MSKKSGFARQIVDWKERCVKSVKDTYMQYLTDMLVLSLNDLGYGEKRLREVLDLWGKNFDLYFDVLTTNPEADYMQKKLDDRIRAICKSGDFIPFAERYEYLPEIKYEIRK